MSASPPLVGLSGYLSGNADDMRLDAGVADIPALNARFESVNGLALDPTGIVWVADGTHMRIYSPITNTVSTACSDRGTHQQPIEFEDALAIAILDGKTILDRKIHVVDNGANKIMVLTPQQD
jgi:outer membrane lipoprotein-sorting protein